MSQRRRWPRTTESLPLRPKTWTTTQDRKRRRQFGVYIEATKRRGEALDHVLLYGLQALARPPWQASLPMRWASMCVSPQALPSKKLGIWRPLTNLNAGDILFIDEIHRLNRVVEEILYPAMEDFAIDIIIGKGPSANSIRLDLPKFTLIGATTRAGQLSSPSETGLASLFVWSCTPLRS